MRPEKTNGGNGNGGRNHAIAQGMCEVGTQNVNLPTLQRLAIGDREAAPAGSPQVLG